jgi:hypothetical protein
MGSRIPYEEFMLVKFFGDKYLDYCKHSYIGIPFIASMKHTSKSNERSTSRKSVEDE